MFQLKVPFFLAFTNLTISQSLSAERGVREPLLFIVDMILSTHPSWLKVELQSKWTLSWDCFVKCKIKNELSSSRSRDLKIIIIKKKMLHCWKWTRTHWNRYTSSPGQQNIYSAWSATIVTAVLVLATKIESLIINHSNHLTGFLKALTERKSSQPSVTCDI